jgi:hypothetical protein
VRQSIGGYLAGGRPLPAGARGVSEERLRQFFESELSDAERQRLLTLPADELYGNLRRLYYLHLQGGAATGLPPGDVAPRRPARGGDAAEDSGRKPLNGLPRNPSSRAEEGR